MDQKGLFENVKYCSVCRRPLPLNFEPDRCPLCEENELFHQVKEFIRSRDVTEYDVAEKFHISIRKVKGWIKEGRIEYKDLPEKKIDGMHCAICGEPIQFGAYCQKCYKLKNAPKYEYTGTVEDERMRFLE